MFEYYAIEVYVGSN